MQPLQPVSIKLIKSMLRIRFMNAFNVLAHLSAVASFSDNLQKLKFSGHFCGPCVLPW